MWTTDAVVCGERLRASERFGGRSLVSCTTEGCAGSSTCTSPCLFALFATLTGLLMASRARNSSVLLVQGIVGDVIAPASTARLSDCGGSNLTTVVSSMVEGVGVAPALLAELSGCAAYVSDLEDIPSQFSSWCSLFGTGSHAPNLAGILVHEPCVC
eukprot:5378265-Amphidinium_carterae.2